MPRAGTTPTQTLPPRDRAQWGSDRKRSPMPAISPPVSERTIVAGRAAVVVTLVAAIAYAFIVVRREIVNGSVGELRKMVEAGVYVAVVMLLTTSALAYMVARIGHFARTRSHHRVPRADLESHFSESTHTLTVVVPSYREDARVVRQTLLSAAIQEFPYMRVVLLIDDPPAPTDATHQAMLDEARALPAEIDALLRLPREMSVSALHDLENDLNEGDATTAHMRMVSAQYLSASSWFVEVAHTSRRGDHTEQFFATQVLDRMANDLAMVAAAIEQAEAEGATLPGDRLIQLMERLTWIFRCELSSFERKQYVSLSAEPNKAMNLNSYLGLMGGAYREVDGPRGRSLNKVTSGHADLEVPFADFVLTLDADSILLPEYCLRLVYELDRPQNERVAVIQTPYSAFPGSSTRLERLAGASTDLQHIVHQGMAYYGATFWVGANAVIRRSALSDIETVDIVDGRAERRYVCDRTVIEDTESSIEMGLHGWTLENYPERLSYSATPPDFGSLVVQRRRWANGGLLIIPKLLAHLRGKARRGERGRAIEGFLRLNYLGSITWATFGLMLLLAYPFDDRLLSPLVVVAAVPYFLTQASDLKRCGYRRTDVLRIYGFNILLLPVNLAGVLKSIVQAVTGRKTPFVRTPKVRSRTTSPVSMVVVPYVLVALSAMVAIRDIGNGDYAHAAFAALNALLCGYAIVAFVGIRNSVADVAVNVANAFLQPARPPRGPRRTAARAPVAPAASLVDWRQVLDVGVDADIERVAPPSMADDALRPVS